MRQFLQFPLVAFILLFTLLPDINAQSEIEKLKKSRDFTPRDFIDQVEYGRIRKVKLYLDAGMDPNAEQKYSEDKAIDEAAYTGNIEMMDLLFKYGAVITPNTMNEAVRRNKDIIGIVNYLKKHGAEVSAETLEMAIYSANREEIMFLLDQGIDLSKFRELRYLCTKKRMDLLKLFIERGADVNKASRWGNVTPLHYAAGQYKNAEILQVLLDAGANIDARNSSGETPIMTAASKNYNDNFNVLYHAGADLHVIDNNWRTVMTHALLSDPVTGDGWVNLFPHSDIVLTLEKEGMKIVNGLGNDEDRMSSYNDYVGAGKWEEALMILREEIISPRKTQDASYQNVFWGLAGMPSKITYSSASGQYRAALRTNAMQLIFRHGADHGYTPEMYEEALEYYESGVEAARYDSSELGTLHLTMGQIVTYFIGVIEWEEELSMPATAINYIQKSLDIAVARNNHYNKITAYQTLSGLYERIGQLELAEQYWMKCYELGKVYFQLERTRVKDAEWVNWFEILITGADYADNLNLYMRLRTLEKLRPLLAEGLIYERAYYGSLATIHAQAGEFGNAWLMYEEALKYYMQESRKDKKDMIGDVKVSTYSRRILKANILMYEKRFEEAFADLDFCYQVRKNSDYDIDMGLQGQLATVYEKLGDYGKALELRKAAVESMEREREFYSLEQRKNYFKTPGRLRGYQLLQYDYANLYINDKREEDFLKSLIASEMYAARQLSESLDIGIESIESISLDAIRKKIGPEDILIKFNNVASYFRDESFLITSYIDDEDQGVLIKTTDPKKFSKSINKVLACLSVYNSNLTDINDELNYLNELLFFDLGAELKGKSNLIIVSEGIVSKIPLEVLQMHGGNESNVVNPKISMLPSINYLFKEHASHDKMENTFFAMGDPEYLGNASETSEEDAALREIQRGSAYLEYFIPLPETKREVESIAGFFEASKTKIYTGHKAKESILKSTDLRKYKYIHIASHGILGNEIPGVIEPALVLANEPGEDGFFLSSEAEELSLNADLTVLSACKTGTGEFVQGEGLMGMSRAFVAAGSQSVLVSLWSVASLETELMIVEFYRNLMKGLPKQEALQIAKEKIRNNKETSHPYYWAPFVLIGY